MHYQCALPLPGKRFVLGLVFALFVVIASAQERMGDQTPTGLEATIFSYDGQDFVRIKTTLRAQDGKSAVDTKLSRASPAYEALIQKRSYSGNITIFGKEYDANYAPLVSEEGRLTGAIFVAVAR